MRHAEKPDDPRDPDLSPAGAARAKALTRYIPDQFGDPDLIFAASISKHSRRPYETVAPLAKHTGTPFDATIADQDYAALAADLLEGEHFAGKQVVVCWHHGNIPSLMRELGAASTDYPDPWDPEVFDLILKLEYPADGAPTVTRIKEIF